MRQRVGFARALVVEPDAAADGRALLRARRADRGEPAHRAARRCGRGDFPAKAILIVTHNIEEAVLLADRVIVLGANPGRIRAEVRIDLERPRDRRLWRSRYSSTALRPTHRPGNRVTYPGTRRGHSHCPAASRRHRRRTRRPRRDRLRATPQHRATRPRRRTQLRDRRPLRLSTPPPCSTSSRRGGDSNSPTSEPNSPPPTSNTASRSSRAGASNVPRWFAPSAKLLAAAPTATCEPGSSLICSGADSRPTPPAVTRHRHGWGRYGELYDYDTVSDEITADPAAGIHHGESPTITATMGASS